MLQHHSELLGGDGFGKEVIHAGSGTTLPVFSQGTRGQGHDRCAPVPTCQLPRTDSAGGLQAVHHRHLTIHQDQVRGRAAGHGVHRLQTIFNHVAGETLLLEHDLRHLAVGGVVIYHQNAPLEGRGHDLSRRHRHAR